jgi:hypothetical protein
MLVLARIADREVGYELLESTIEAGRNALAFIEIERREDMYEQEWWSATARHEPQKRTTLLLIKRVDDLT